MIPNRRCVVIFVVLALPAAMVLPVWAAGQVQLELVGDAGGAAMAFQEWARTLGRAGIRNVRIRSGKATDRVGVQVRGTEASPVYVVTGIIRSRDELLLPPGRFRRSDIGRLARWLDELARLGPEDQRQPPGPFGLTAAQFEQLQDGLSRPVAFSTSGITRRAAVEGIAAQLGPPLSIEPALSDALAEDSVAEQLQGLASGTALAYVLRPAGMCLVPRGPGARPACAVVRARPNLQIWPVGWEPERPVRELLPALFEFHNVNVQNVPVGRTLEAIGKILKVPVLLDHNALARWGIDPAKALVTHPRSRTTYGIALGKILFQAGLKYELRLDEARQPFLWVTSLKPM